MRVVRGPFRVRPVFVLCPFGARTKKTALRFAHGGLVLGPVFAFGIDPLGLPILDK